MEQSSTNPTVGVLFPGEMGAALGGLLSRAGRRVVTTVAERGPRTRSLAVGAGLEVLGSLEDVVAESHVLLSLVPPGAALSVASRVAECRRIASGALYVDGNSIAPETARAVAATVTARGMRFADAAVHGQAQRLPEHGIVYLSGTDAEEMMGLFEGIVRTRWLGSDLGRASAMKMLMSGMSKGVAALFLELALTAREASLMDEFFSGCGQWYPDVFALARRTLPTYPRHAARRADEIGELERTMRELGLEPEIVPGIGRLIRRLSESYLSDYAQSIDDGLFDTDDLLELIALDNPLRPCELATRTSY